MVRHPGHGLSSKVLLIGAGLLPFMATFAAANAAPAAPEEPDFAAVLQTHAEGLTAVTSDDQALTLFTSRLGPALGLEERAVPPAGKRPAGPALGKPPRDEVQAPDQRQVKIKLTAELAAWRLAAALQLAADGDLSGVAAALRSVTAHQEWLLARTEASHLRPALHLGSVLAARPPSQVPLTDPLPGFHEYVSRLDDAYPKLSGSDDSWVALAEAKDLDGITRRLLDAAPASDPSDRQAFASRYFDTRLRPLLAAQLAAQAIRAEADAEQTARREWRRLRHWREQLMERKGLARLCGTWHWTVHNHQNHQERKLVMSFAAPDAPNGAGPRPAKIIVLGDLVYLRWEFERGVVQEDSLLFAGEGQRLEGTFVNSGGPRGSITAKRVAACAGIEGESPTISQGGPASTPKPGTPSRQ